MIIPGKEFLLLRPSDGCYFREHEVLDGNNGEIHGHELHVATVHIPLSFTNFLHSLDS
jgi:hypothetical protein